MLKENNFQAVADDGPFLSVSLSIMTRAQDEFGFNMVSFSIFQTPDGKL